MESEEPSQRAQLDSWLKENEVVFQKVLRPIAAGIANLRGISVDETVGDLFNEIVMRALPKAETFSGGSHRAWLLIFGVNIAKRWKDDAIKSRKREVRESNFPDSDSAPEQFERLLEAKGGIEPDPSLQVVDRLSAEFQLSQLPAAHKETLQAFIDADFDTDEAASRQNTNSVTFRQRLHRARKAFMKQFGTSLLCMAREDIKNE